MQGRLNFGLTLNSFWKLTKIFTLTALFCSHCNVQAATWTLGTGTNTFDPQTNAISATGQYVISAGRLVGQALRRSIDYGVTWSTVGRADLHWYSCSMSSSGQYQHCLWPARPFYSHDYGATWAYAGQGDVSWNLVTTSGSGAYTIATRSATIWRSTGYGTSYGQVFTSSPATDFVALAMDNSAQYAVAHASTSYIYTSSNYGATWTSNTNMQMTTWNSSYLAMSKWGGKVYFVSRVSSHIYKNTNNGVGTFTQLTPPQNTFYWKGIHCDWTCARMIANVVDTNGRHTLHRSFDGGASWELVDAGTTWSPTKVAMATNGTAVVAGNYQQQGIYYSSDFWTTAAPSRAPTFAPSTVAPTAKPTSAAPTSQPSSQPSSQPTNSHRDLILSAPSYKVRNGFAFAAIGDGGQARTWGEAQHGGDSSAVPHFLQSGVARVVGSRFAFAAVKGNGSVAAWGAPAARAGLQDQGALDLDPSTLVANEAAFAGVDSVTRGVVTFGCKHHGSGLLDEITCPECADHLAAGVRSVTASAGAFAALKTDGSLFVWGNRHTGATESASALAAVTALSGAKRVVANRQAFAVHLADNTVVAWGDASTGGDTTAVAAQLTEVFHLTASSRCFVAYKRNTGAVVWGYGAHGGDTSAVASALSAGVICVAFTSTAMAAVKEDRSVVTWGKASSGGDSLDVQASMVGVERVVGNSRAFAALTTSGSVIAWGSPTYGGSIPGDKLSALSSGVVSIHHTDRAFAALKEDGSVVVWGQAGHGGSPSAAVEALLASGVHTVCANDVAFSAIKSDGSVVAWGHEVSIATEGVQFTSAAFQQPVVCA